MNPAGFLAHLFAFVDSFVKPGGRSSARLLAIGGGSCAAVYILADVALRIATTIVVVMVQQKSWPAGVGMEPTALLTAFGTLVTLGGGTYWIHNREATKRAQATTSQPGGDAGPGAS